MSQSLKAVGRRASWRATEARAWCGDGSDVPLDVVEKSIASKLAVKDQPSCNNKGAMDGVVHKAKP